jgi:hypothetical protein
MLDKDDLNRLVDETTDELIQKIGLLNLNKEDAYSAFIFINREVFASFLSAVILEDMVVKKTSLTMAKEKIDRVTSSFLMEVKQSIKPNLADWFMKVKDAVQNGSGIRIRRTEK